MDANERLARARAQIMHRSNLAAIAAHGPWEVVPNEDDTVTIDRISEDDHDCGEEIVTSLGHPSSASHIAASDPDHVLAVLDIAGSILDRHARTHTCVVRWTDDGSEVGQYVWPVLFCADAKPVLDLYAPEPADA